MPFRMALTSTQREKMGVLVNNFSVFAAQLLTGSNQEIVTRAFPTLAGSNRERRLAASTG